GHCAVAVELLALLAPAGSGAADSGSIFASLAQSRLVHCAFYKAYEVDSRTGDHVLVEGHSSSLTHFQGIQGDHARQISTRMAGAREVRGIRGAKYLPFGHPGAGMNLPTPVYRGLGPGKHGPLGV